MGIQRFLLRYGIMAGIILLAAVLIKPNPVNAWSGSKCTYWSNYRSVSYYSMVPDNTADTIRCDVQYSIPSTAGWISFNMPLGATSFKLISVAPGAQDGPAASINATANGVSYLSRTFMGYWEPIVLNETLIPKDSFGLPLLQPSVVHNITVANISYYPSARPQANFNIEKSPIPAPGIFNLTVTPSCSANMPRNSLTWTQSTNAVDYTIYRNGSALITLPATARSYSDTSSTLVSGQSYTYKVTARSAGGVRDSNIVSIRSSFCESPVVITDFATSILVDSARLNGRADPRGSTSTGWFRYSITNPGVCNDSFGTRTLDDVPLGNALGSSTSYSKSVSGLVSNTTYYYCAIAQNTFGKGYGTVQSFVTGAMPTVDLKINNQDGPISIPYNTAATLTWTSINTSSCIANNEWPNINNPDDLMKDPNNTLGETTGPLVANKIYTLSCSGMFGGIVSDSVTVNVNQLPPDLVITSTSVTPATVKIGDMVTISGVVKNNGAQTAQDTFNLARNRLEFDENNDGDWDIVETRMLGNLNPGASETEVFADIWIATPGTHRYVICADSTGRIVESDETNNCREETITVEAADADQQEVTGDVFADGGITGITVDPESVIAAGRIVDVTGGKVFLENYRPTTSNSFAIMTARIREISSRLIAERGRKLEVNSLNPSIDGLVNLNTLAGVHPQSGSPVNDFLRPEGSVWVHRGNLTIKPSTFVNRGTIIVIGGDVTITTGGPASNTLTYRNLSGRSDSFGLIVLDEAGVGGNISIDRSITSLVGSYFATKSIKVE